MKAIVILLFAVCYVQCRKTYAPINKNANIDFINMEGGGGARPPNNQPLPAKPVVVPPSPLTPAKPSNVPISSPTPAKPSNVPVPSPTPAPVKPVNGAPGPTQKPAMPVPGPSQIKPVPVNPKPVANPITTPGPGTVKQLVNFYDSQGKASPIRPYSYSQAVKQG